MFVIATSGVLVKVAVTCNAHGIDRALLLSHLKKGMKHLCKATGAGVPKDTLADILILNDAVPVGPGYQFDAVLGV